MSGRVIREVISGAVSHDDRDNEYTLETSDPHAIIAASKGVNNANISFNLVSSAEETLTFILVESVVVELGSTETGMGHDCSCSDYSAHSPCSHVYWAVDQVVRAEVLGGHRDLEFRNYGGNLEVESPEGFIYRPATPPQGLNIALVQKAAQDHTSPKVRFRDTTDKEKGRIAQILVRLSERSYTALDVGGPRTCSAGSAHNTISSSASSLLSSYAIYRATLRDRNEIVDAIESATSSFLWMMRAVVIRTEPNGLRLIAARAYWDSADGECFWYHANAFFTSYGREIRQHHRVHLTNLYNYVLSTQMQYDTNIITVMAEWPMIA